MKTSTTNNYTPQRRGPIVFLATLLMTLYWGLTSGYAQEVLNISAATHSRNGTVSSWTVPSGGPYKIRITARGAKGGIGNTQLRSNPKVFNPGGAGAILSGEFIVSSGQVLEANAGAPGQDFPFTNGGGGGGGASGARIQNGAPPLVIAGGGGAGSGGFSSVEPGNAALTSSASDQGGSAPNGSGGGGLSTPGANGEASTGGGAGYNATGGDSGGSGGGGFGAGGAGRYGGGGGGGYSGGSGGGAFSNQGGGGGGSYNLGSNPSNSVGNTGGGQVIIEILGVEPLAATSLSPTQPVCATPTQGSVSIDPTYQGSVSDLEYAIVAGNAFTGTPKFTAVPSDPFSVSSGFGTTADADGETYTVRLRLKANTGVYVDRTYTLTSSPSAVAGALSSNVASICQGGIVDISHTSSTGTIGFVVFQNGTAIASYGSLTEVETSFASLAPGVYCVYSFAYLGLNNGCGNFAGFTLAQIITACFDGQCYNISDPLCITVNSIAIGPTLLTKTPNVAAVCKGTGVSATFNAGSGGVGCSDDYVLIIDGGAPVAYTPGSIVGAAASTSIVIQGRRANCSAGSGCNGTAFVTLVNVTVNPLPTVNAGPDQSAILGFGGPNSNCTALTATPSGGSGGGYSYIWNSGASTDQTFNVCPQITTTYEVTVTDGNMCTSVPDHVTVNVQDVRCGPKLDKVSICYYGVTLCVSEKIAKNYLKLGATLGGCGTGNARIGVGENSELPLQLTLKAYPNPVQDAVTLEVLSRVAGVATFEVLDVAGRVRQSRQQELVEGLNEVEFKLGTLPTGIYLIKAVDALGQQGVVRVSKQ